MAKRINTPFVVALVASFCFMGVCAFAWVSISTRFFERPIEERVKEEEALARKLVSQERYGEAKEAITTAWLMDKKNKEVCLERGDILMLLTDEEGHQAVDTARASWENAVAIDSHFKPALNRLLDSYVDQMEIAPAAQTCERLGSTAARILKFDAADPRARAYQQIAVVQEWVLGQAKTPEEIKTTFARLQELLAQDPSNAEVLFYIVRGKVFAASDAYQQAHYDDAQAYLKQARALLDQATRAFPDNASLNFRAFQGYVAIADTEQDSDRLAGAAIILGTDGPVEMVRGIAKRLFHLGPSQAAKDLAAADAVLRHARETVKEGKSDAGAVLIGLEKDHQRETVKNDERRYADFQFVAGEWARRNGRPEEAEKILREYYNNHKADQLARLALCHILALARDPTNPLEARRNEARRDEAIQILEQPVRRTGRPGYRPVTLKELESQTLLDLTSLRVSLYPNLEPSRRPALLAQIDDGYNRIRAIAVADAIPVLRLKGLIEQLKGLNVDAVETLSRAWTLLKTSDPGNPIKYDLMYQLASVERLAGQNKAAETLLEELVERYKDYTPARLQLAESYLDENDAANAVRHIEIIDKLMPNSQEVLRLKVNLARIQERTEDVKVLYNRLSETTFEDKLIKARVAGGQKDYDETIRLLKDMERMKPDQTAITVAIYQGYVRKATQAAKDGKGGAAERQVAKQFLEDALRMHPNDPKLLLVKRETEHPMPVQPDRITLELMAANGNPLYVEVEAGFVALSQQNYADAIVHARAADRIRPDDPATWDLYFQIYKEQQNWDATSEAARKLGELDADHANGRMYRWTLAMLRANYSDAIRVARDLTVDRATFGQSWVLLAEALQANGEYHEAIQYYEAALDRQSTNIEAYKGMATCWQNLGQPDRAREIVERGMRLFPDDPGLREALFSFEAVIDPVKVVPKRRKLLNANPDDPENYINLAHACNRAAERIFPKDPVQAQAFNNEGLDTLTRAAGRFPEDIRLNRELALELYSARRFDDGVKVLQAMQTTPRWKDKPDPLMMLAEYYTRAHRYDEAEAAYKAAWATTRNLNVEIELRLASFYHLQKKYDKALDLLKANATDPRVVLQALQIHIAANHTQQAIKGLDDALKTDPESPELLNLKAAVLIDGFDYVQARSVILHVLTIDPRNDPAMFFQAMVELRDPITSDLDLALNDLRVIVTRNPRNMQYRLLYVDALVRVNEMELACAELDSAVRMDPLNREIRLKLLDMQIRLKKWPQFKETVQFAEVNPALGAPIWYRSHAYGFAANKQYPEAIERIQMAISMAPTNLAFVRDYLIILLSANKWGDVIRETDTLMNSGNHDWWVYHVRGLARFGLKNTPQAMEEFDHAMKAADALPTPEAAQSAWQQVLDSMAEIDVDQALERVARLVDRNDHWRLQSVSLHMRKQDWAGALHDLDALIPRRNQLRRDDRLSTVRFAAECYQASGQSRQAEDFYSEWLKEAPNDPAALNNYACLLAENPARLEKARVYSQRAYDAGRKFNNPDPLIIDTHGWILSRLGGQDADNGLDILKELVDSHRDMVDARYHLGLALLIQHRNTEGIAELTAALDLIKKREDEIKTPFRPDLKAKIQAELSKAKKPFGAPATAP